MWLEVVGVTRLRMLLTTVVLVLVITSVSFPREVQPADYWNSFYAGIPRSLDLDQEITVLLNRGFVVGYSDERKDPLWVCYRLFRADDVPSPRPDFDTDERTKAKVSENAYTNSGYDRGHMAPNDAIHNCFGEGAQEATFLMSNICPQLPTLHRSGEPWAVLERTVAGYADPYEEVWVICGPVFDHEVQALSSGVEIPDAFYMIVVDEDGGVPRMLGFVMPQTASETVLERYQETVESIQKRTGFDFFWELGDAVETQLEATSAALWSSSSALSASSSPTASASPSFVLDEVDPRAECVTLRNASGARADLKGWRLSDGEGSYTFGESILVDAGETYTVCINVYNPTGNRQGLYLNDKRDQVYLYCPGPGPGDSPADVREWGSQ